MPFPRGGDAVRRELIELAQYARSLEQEIAASKPKEKSPAEIQAAAVKLASAARSGIKKQMSWKPSCKSGTAKWMYDGVCNDPLVFAAMLGMKELPKFKTKKMPAPEFEALIGDLQVSVRYDYLNINGNVNIHWNPEDGTFKFSGTYGK